MIDFWIVLTSPKKWKKARKPALLKALRVFSWSLLAQAFSAQANENVGIFVGTILHARRAIITIAS